MDMPPDETPRDPELVHHGDNSNDCDDESSDTMQHSIGSIGSMSMESRDSEIASRHLYGGTTRDVDGAHNIKSTGLMTPTAELLHDESSNSSFATLEAVHNQSQLQLPAVVIFGKNITDQDVLVETGDGGQVNVDNHVGNHAYMMEVTKRQGPFATASSDKEKRAIRRELIRIIKDRGGRFLIPHTGSSTIAERCWKEIKDKALNTKVERDLGDVRIYIDGDVTKVDYLVGRGGHNIRHPGNQAYLDEKDRLQEAYLNAKTRDEKHQISKDLVHWVHARGGRFLKRKAGTDKWYIVSNDTAYKQARQKLTEPRKKAATRPDEHTAQGQRSHGVDSEGRW